MSPNAGARAALGEERRLRQQLQTDFEYNVSLVRERDGELGTYEAAFTRLRDVVNQLTAEGSELKVREWQSGGRSSLPPFAQLLLLLLPPPYLLRCSFQKPLVHWRGRERLRRDCKRDTSP